MTNPPYPPYLRILPVALVTITLGWIMFEILNWRSGTDVMDLDHRIVQLMRQPENPARIIGPPAVEEAIRDFTGLGGYAVLTTATIGFAVFAMLELSRSTFYFFWLTAAGGYGISVLMKRVVQRERPSIVPHLSHVAGSTSFPSSHAMMSVIVYVTIGLLLSELTNNRHLQRLLIGLPLLVALVVGMSRICMGVHFPSDVLGGWTGGLLWTWIAFLIRGRSRKLIS